MKQLGFLIHDVLAHPFCGLLWIVGEWIPAFEKAGEWLHEITVFQCNWEDEEWERPFTEEQLRSSSAWW